MRAGAFALLAAATFVIQAGAVMAFNVAIDPRSEFPVDLVDPLVEDERLMKTGAYAKLDAKPEAIILGSSRAWGLPPDVLVEHGYAGAYNFALGGATTADALRVIDFVAARGPTPRVVFYAIEDWQLGATIIPNWREGGPASHADAPELAARAFQSLRLDYVRDSWKALDAHFDDAPKTWAFQDNGSVAWERFEAQKLEGTWTLGDASAHFLDGVRAHYAPGSRWNDERVRDLAAIASRTRAYGSELVLFLPPMHPEGAVLLPRETYEAGVAAARELLVAQCANGVRVHDLTEPASYGSDLAGFVDGWHYGTGEGRRILEHLMEAPDLCGQVDKA